MSQTIEKALAIAAADLRWCYREKGIMTGSRLVYWSWDSFFASYGSLRLGDNATVRSNLELYLSLQNKQGNVPKRIAHPLYWMKFLGIPIKEHPGRQQETFWNTYFTSQSITQGPTLLIALGEYVRHSDDDQFFAANLTKVEKLLAFLASKERDGLLWEGIGGGWAESVLKRGAIAFTNMCYAKALQSVAELYARQGSDDDRQRVEEKYRRTVARIQERLWLDEDGGYFSDWFGMRRHHHFATDGNLLAIMWGIATKDQAKKIQAKISQLALEDDIPIRLAYRDYSFWRVYLFNRIGGVKDYHVGFCWSWLGCIDVVAKSLLGQDKDAERTLEKIAAVIVRDGTVHETYDNGRPVHTPFYKSERPWAWGAGLFVEACYQLGYRLK